MQSTSHLAFTTNSGKLFPMKEKNENPPRYQKQTCLLFLAPKAVEATATSSSTVRVKITPHGGGETVDHYRAYAGKPDSQNSCTVAASSSKLECDITGLKAVTEYKVGARACLEDDGGCGKAVETTVTTPPPRELRIHRIECWPYAINHHPPPPSTRKNHNSDVTRTSDK